MEPSSAENPIEVLSSTLGQEWPVLRGARERAIRLKSEFARITEGMVPREDASMVVFGSLARNEVTSGSDTDWTVLIDGQASSTHMDVSREIERRLEISTQKGPGREHTFGGVAFSHELLHRIGGGEDTNRNLTQRILLLLESEAIGPDDAYRRVISGVLDRYVTEDPGWNEKTVNVPRFLVNDIARYWRTVAVDFAYKRRSRGAEGWALRTIKLRLSRKLTYVSGLLACFSCALAREFASAEDRSKAVVDHLVNLTRLTPLELVARVLHSQDQLESAAELFGSYDEFLALLDDEDARQHLEELRPENAAHDSLYQDARRLGHRFQHALNAVFLEENGSDIPALTKRYAVF